jgi:predicted acyl esterase
MTRPVRGPLNASATDHVTDAYDTIDWLVKNTPESNGRVGMIGSSYEGFTVVMAMLNPHPALKVAVPESPMVDGWMGDDWFHYGAIRWQGDIHQEKRGPFRRLSCACQISTKRHRLFRTAWVLTTPSVVTATLSMSLLNGIARSPDYPSARLSSSGIA